MNMKRRITSWLLVLFLFAGILCSMATGDAYAEDDYIKPAKKIVSIVYDDSGSMFDGNDSWAQANYSIQAVASMMDEADELYITYMSDLSTERSDLSNPLKATHEIRNYEKPSGGTPLYSVELAMEQLKSIQDTKLNTQYWLMIFTDGGMYPDTGKESYGDLQSMLDDYKGTIMANGSEVNIRYLEIGYDNVSIHDAPGSGFTAEACGEDIIPAITHISNEISGRIPFASSDIKVIDERTIKVHSDLPLYSIVALSQKSKATVKSVKGEISLQIERDIDLNYPLRHNQEIPFSSSATKKNLTGHSAMITNGNELIPAGDYTIKFDKKVDMNNVTLMYQPAIGLKMKLSKDGEEVDKDMVFCGDQCDVELIPVNPKTGDPLDDSYLPENVSWKIQFEVDGNLVDSKDSKQLAGITIQQGTNKITGYMTIEHFSPIVATIIIECVQVNYEIIAEESDHPEYLRKGMEAGKCIGSPYKFYLAVDGKKLGKDEIPKGIKLVLKESSYVDGSATGKNWFENGGCLDADTALTLCDDGGFELHPKYPGLSKFGYLIKFLVRSGRYDAVVEMNNGSGNSASGYYIVTGSIADWDTVPIVVGLFLCGLYTIYIIFIKKKFNNQRVVINVYSSEDNTTGGLIPNLSKRIVLKKWPGLSILKPGSSSYRLPYGIKVYAGESGIVYMKKDSIKRFELYGSSGRRPERAFGKLINSLKKTKGKKEEKQIPEMKTLSREPFYLYKNGYLYQITMQN